MGERGNGSVFLQPLKCGHGIAEWEPALGLSGLKADCSWHESDRADVGGGTKSPRIYPPHARSFLFPRTDFQIWALNEPHGQASCDAKALWISRRGPSGCPTETGTDSTSSVRDPRLGTTWQGKTARGMNITFRATSLRKRLCLVPLRLFWFFLLPSKKEGLHQIFLSQCSCCRAFCVLTICHWADESYFWPW